MTRNFHANPKAIDEAIDELRKKPGGGIRTLEDAQLLASRRRWAEAPLIGEFTPSNAYLFWRAVEDEIWKRMNS